MMKTISKQVIGLTIISSSLFLPNIAQAITVEEVINPRENNSGWVTDWADILSSQTELQLNQIINNLETTNGTEIAVVTVPDTNSYPTPKAFTTELFNYWRIGKADVDNGVLFLISLGDRRVEIETGYGIEPILPNTEVKEIIDTKITPEFKQG
ncbi:MAG: TPM domain-containing protein, partial [Pleurocapsa sp.]